MDNEVRQRKEGLGPRVGSLRPGLNRVPDHEENDYDDGGKTYQMRNAIASFRSGAATSAMPDNQQKRLDRQLKSKQNRDTSKQRSSNNDSLLAP